jgi:hypothetical protein
LLILTLVILLFNFLILNLLGDLLWANSNVGISFKHILGMKIL